MSNQDPQERAAGEAGTSTAEEVLALRKALADISIRAITGQHFETLDYKNREFAKIEAIACAALSKVESR